MPVDNFGVLVDESCGVRVIHNLSTERVCVIHKGNQQIVSTVNWCFAVYVMNVTELQSRNFTNVNKPVDNFLSRVGWGKLWITAAEGTIYQQGVGGGSSGARGDRDPGSQRGRGNGWFLRQHDARGYGSGGGCAGRRSCRGR